MLTKLISSIRVIRKVTMSLGLLSPLIPTTSGIPEVKTF
jgi:hypothetical protein